MALLIKVALEALFYVLGCWLVGLAIEAIVRRTGHNPLRLSRAGIVVGLMLGYATGIRTVISG